MSSRDIVRRSFLRATGLALGGCLTTPLRHLRAQDASVPNSAGANTPRLVVPINACDSHIHIYDPARFKMTPSRRVPPGQAAVSHYRRLQRRLGTSRVVVVTPRNYGIDNAVTLDALRQLAPHARGVAVVDPSVTDEELNHMHDAGVRGIRFSLNDPATAVVSFDMVEPLAERVAHLGWHLQFHLEGRQIVERASVLRRLPVPLVFDHMGRPPLDQGLSHASHGVVLDLVSRGRTWVKLSGAYLNSRTGPPYRDAVAIAQSLVAAAPERMVWGSDWPHPTEADHRKPNDADLLDLLMDIVPGEAARRRILVDNPARLYDFVTPQ